MKFFVKEVLKELDNNEVTVVAATKYFNSEEMRELFSEGITHFGENRVELLLEKSSNLEDLDITWHLIGTLQTKKVKKVINLVSYLHSLDNIKLAEEVNKRRTSPLKCFIQVNISNEETKHGLEINEVIPFLEAIASYENINIIGFMGMASYTSNEEEISNQFQKLNDLTKYVNDVTNLNISDLSIGMSNDYLIALKHDSTFLRLGSVLFKKEV
jgi:pyridoxal phosphate enzyme (YggS family)